MNRRDTLKSLLLGSVAAGLALNGCSPNKTETQTIPQSDSTLYGRTPTEKLRDKKLFKEIFLNKHELLTIATLCDIILPKSDKYGSATDAGVKEFINFIVKDMAYQQTPVRGGLMWLDNYSNKLYNKEFNNCTSKEQYLQSNSFSGKNKTGINSRRKVFYQNAQFNLNGIFYFKNGN